jgi:hypothetical protein
LRIFYSNLLIDDVNEEALDSIGACIDAVSHIRLSPPGRRRQKKLPKKSFLRLS